MTTLSQSDTFNIPGRPQERFAPSGAVEFAREERVPAFDSVADLARMATELAAPMHQVSPGETIDQRRIEFGGSVVEVVRQAPSATLETIDYSDPQTLARFSSNIVALRLAASRPQASSQER